MKLKLVLATLLLSTLLLASRLAHADEKAAVIEEPDRYQWLEDINGDKAMAWVKTRNSETVKALASTPEFAQMKARILEVLDSDARIPYVQRMGKYLYNLW